MEFCRVLHKEEGGVTPGSSVSISPRACFLPRCVAAVSLRQAGGWRAGGCVKSRRFNRVNREVVSVQAVMWIRVRPKAGGKKLAGNRRPTSLKKKGPAPKLLAAWASHGLPASHHLHGCLSLSTPACPASSPVRQLPQAGLWLHLLRPFCASASHDSVQALLSLVHSRSSRETPKMPMQ